MKTLYFHGSLKEKFGESFRFDAFNPAEIIRSACAQIKGFQRALEEGEFQIKREEDLIDVEELGIGFGSSQNLHLVPVLHGSKNSGMLKVATGVAIVAASLITMGAAGAGLGAAWATVGGASITYGQVAMLGVALTFAGISSMLSSPQAVDNYMGNERPDERASFLFNGATNSSTQGVPVPLVYGQFEVGSIVASTGIAIERIN